MGEKGDKLKDSLRGERDHFDRRLDIMEGTTYKLASVANQQAKELSNQSREIANQSREIADQSKDIANQSREIAKHTQELSKIAALWEASNEMVKEWLPRFFWLFVALISISTGINIWKLSHMP